MKFFVDKYTMMARVFPSALGVIPFIFVLNFVPIESVFLKIVTTGVFSTALIYIFTQFFIRIPAKMFEDWLFSNGLKMPTTDLLLYKDLEYSDQFKNNIRSQIKRDFNISLSSKKEEFSDEIGARRKIKDATRLMIGKVKGGYLLFKHNCEYGFSRNIWSSSIIGAVGSLVLLFLAANNRNKIFIIVALTLIFLYVCYILFGHFLIKYTGKLYARKLIEEYYEN